MLGGADNPNGELLSYIIGADIGIEINSEYIKMGLRRLDVASHYSAEELAKVKKRKTGNRSKRCRVSEVDPDLIAK
ncbi:hypothetical protein ECDEC13E_3786 [Escherichia coli DEC13E]|nr:hypothetical protein ECDEC13E_3786 [Escherichia coli DEC13E]